MATGVGVGTAVVALGTDETTATIEADVAVTIAEGGTGNTNSACQSNMARQAKWQQPFMNQQSHVNYRNN